MKDNKKLKSFLRTLGSYLTLPALFLLLVVSFSLFSDRFAARFDLYTMILKNTHVMILVVGLVFVIASGGIDISVGYEVALVSILTALLLRTGMNVWLCMLCGILAGVACGALNGFLITVTELAPFLATLASQVMFKGITYILSSGKIFSKFPDSFRVISETYILGIPTDLWIVAACLLILFFVLKYTYYGKYIMAIGENEDACKNSGVNIKLIKLFCYIVCGFFSALAALIMISNFGRAASYNGPGLEITGITAVYFSAAAIPMLYRKGNKYRVWDIIFSTLILLTISEAMRLTGLSQYLQYFLTGLILAGAFIISRRRSKVHEM